MITDLQMMNQYLVPPMFVLSSATCGKFQMKTICSILLSLRWRWITICPHSANAKKKARIKKLFANHRLHRIEVISRILHEASFMVGTGSLAQCAFVHTLQYILCLKLISSQLKRKKSVNILSLFKRSNTVTLFVFLVRFIGGFKKARGTCAPSRVQFLSFPSSFWQKVC